VLGGSLGFATNDEEHAECCGIPLKPKYTKVRLEWGTQQVPLPSIWWGRSTVTIDRGWSWVLCVYCSMGIPAGAVSLMHCGFVAEGLM
jgi:hypothetical protein